MHALRRHLNLIGASQDEDISGIAVGQDGEVCVLPHVLHLRGSMTGPRLYTHAYECFY